MPRKTNELDTKKPRTPRKRTPKKKTSDLAEAFDINKFKFDETSDKLVRPSVLGSPSAFIDAIKKEEEPLEPLPETGDSGRRIFPLVLGVAGALFCFLTIKFSGVPEVPGEGGKPIEANPVIVPAPKAPEEPMVEAPAPKEAPKEVVAAKAKPKPKKKAAERKPASKKAKKGKKAAKH